MNMQNQAFLCQKKSFKPRKMLPTQDLHRTGISKKDETSQTI